MPVPATLARARPPAVARGVIINEFSDALGTGNYVYEFVELHNDP